MSYLLDALRKSDRERRQSEEPALASIHLQRRFGARSRQRQWRAAIAVATIVLLAVGAWWGWQTGLVALPKLTLASRSVPMAKPGSQSTGTTAVENTTSAVVASQSPAQPHAPARMPDETTLPTLWDLPAVVRNRIPALKFSLHAYSDDPARRSMVVNDRVVHEGDQIADNLTLVKITADGAVLRYRDTWFRVNVLENW